MLPTIPLPRSGAFSPVIKRRRGGRPGNSNSRKHSGYSVLHPLPQAARLQPVLTANHSVLKRLARLTGQYSVGPPRFLFWSCQLLSITRADTRIFRSIFELSGRQSHLHALLPEVALSIDCELRLRHIQPCPVSVPQELGNFHANSPPAAPSQVSTYLGDTCRPCSDWHALCFRLNLFAFALFRFAERKRPLHLNS